jgi:Tfp pilus assembly protein PilN
MAQPARGQAEDVPDVDPAAVDRAYRYHRERRRARIRHSRERKRARLRFWVVLLLLTGLAIYLMLLVWSQVEQLFGL